MFFLFVIVQNVVLHVQDFHFSAVKSWPLVFKNWFVVGTKHTAWQHVFGRSMSSALGTGGSHWTCVHL